MRWICGDVDRRASCMFGLVLFHSFDMLENPTIPLIQTAISAKRSWLKRMMKPGVSS